MTDPIKAEPVAWVYEYGGGTIACTAIRYEPAVLRALGWTETPLYTHTQLIEERRLAWNEAIEAALAEVITDQTIDKHGAHCCCTTCELNVAEAGIRALTKDITHD